MTFAQFFPTIGPMSLFPAIVIGGPPHSGKSVLSVSLTRALRARKIDHYLLRAAPDGEGNWSNAISDDVRFAIRFAGKWSQRWVDYTCCDIAARTLPLLVDVGGKLSPENFEIFDQCTDMIVLSKDLEQQRGWEVAARDHDLRLLASFESQLRGNTLVHEHAPVLRGVLSSLERGTYASGPAFDALVDRVGERFRYEKALIDRMHLGRAPDDCLLVRLDQPLNPVGFDALTRHYDFAQRAAIVDAAAPEGEPLALYGPGPSWLASEFGSRRDVRWLFDARMGWMRPPVLRADAPLRDDNAYMLDALHLTVERHPGDRFILRFRLPDVQYLDADLLNGKSLPALPARARILLDGKLPLWFYAAAARAYAGCAQVLGNQHGGGTDVTQHFFA